MKRITGENWFIKGNKQSRSLNRLYVSIDTVIDDKTVYYFLTVTDQSNTKQHFGFYTQEDVMRFVEDEIVNCSNNAEVVQKYQELYEQGKFVGYDEETGLKKITLSVANVLNLIEKYYGSYQRDNLKAKCEYQDNEGHPHVSFSIVETGVPFPSTTYLTKKELKDVFEYNLAVHDDYKLVDFEFVFGSKPTGKYVDDATPSLDGIVLKVKEKGLKKALKPQKKDTK